MKKKLTAYLLMLLLLCSTWFSGCSSAAEEPTQGATEQSQTESIDEDGWYYSTEDVALYLHTYGELPENFITKKEANC